MSNSTSKSIEGVEVFRDPGHTEDDFQAIISDAVCSRPVVDPATLAAERQKWLKATEGRVVLESRTHLQVIFPHLFWTMSTTSDAEQPVSLAVDLDPDSHRYHCLVRGDVMSRTVSTIRCATPVEIAHAENARLQWRTALHGGRPPEPPEERTCTRFPGTADGLTRFSASWQAWTRPAEFENVPFQFWDVRGEEGVGGRYWISASAVIDAACEDSMWERVGALFHRTRATVCIARASDFVPSAHGPYSDFDGRTSL